MGLSSSAETFVPAENLSGKAYVRRSHPAGYCLFPG
jgi:hypothetical protein